MALTASTAPAKAAPDDPYLIYVANRQVAKGQSQWPVILRADAATGALSELSRNGRQGNLFVHPYDLAVERDGSLIVADMGQFASDDPTPDGAIIRIDPRNGTQSLVSQGGALVDPAGVAVASDGALYVLENVGVGGVRGVIRIDPLTGAQTGVARGGELCNPFGIAFDPRGDLVVADYGTLVLSSRPIVECPRATGSLVRIERSTGRQAVLAEGNLLRNPLGLAIEPGGRILVANESVNAAAAVVAVDTVTGQQSVVASNTGGDLFRLPERIALAPDGRLLVTDFELADRFGGIVGVAPEDGAQTAGWGASSSTIRSASRSSSTARRRQPSRRRPPPWPVDSRSGSTPRGPGTPRGSACATTGTSTETGPSRGARWRRRCPGPTRTAAR